MYSSMNMTEFHTSTDNGVLEELEALRHRLLELEEIEVMRVSEEQERFDSLQVLDEYAKQLEMSRDQLMRLFRAGAGVQEAKTVQEVLQRIADSVGEAGWGSVSVNLFDNWDVIQSAYYGVSQEDIDYLTSHRRDPQERARFYGPDFDRFRVSRSYFVPADSVVEVISTEGVVPGRRTVQAGDTWDPMDLAYVPLYGSGGKVIGTINCDDPVDGQRPTAETFFYLELFADLAARKVETEQLLERQRTIDATLRVQEERYRAIFNASSDAFMLMDELFRDCNNQTCELWRCTRDDVIGHSPIEFSPEYQPDGRTSEEAALVYIHKAMAGEPQRFYWMHKRKDGELIDCEVSLSRVDMGTGSMVMAVVRDLSENRRAEEERKKLASLVENSSDYIALISPDGRMLYINPSGLRMCGLESLHDAKSDRIDTHFLRTGSSDPLTALGSVLVCGHWEGEMMVRDFQSAKIIPAQVHMFAVWSADGKEITAVGTVVRDMSALRQAEVASMQSEDALRWLVENLEDPVGIVDTNEKFIDVNPAMAAVFGLKQAELVGRTMEEFVDRPTFEMIRGMTALRQKGVRNRYTLEIRRADGEYRMIEIVATPQFDREGHLRSVIASAKDISRDANASPGASE